MIGFQIATESSRISPKETQLATYHAPMGLDPHNKRDSHAGKPYLLGYSPHFSHTPVNVC